MGQETVEVTIGADGKVSIGVSGIAGDRCLDETAELVRALGGAVESQELTAEAYIDQDRAATAEREQRW